MTSHKKYLAWIFGILILGVIIIIVTRTIHIHTSTPAESPSRYMDIESYVRNDISDLSPVKEELGGTFYVTSIETHNGAGTVSYEDGHNAYTADFTYTVDGDGKPAITDFTVRQ